MTKQILLSTNQSHHEGTDTEKEEVTSLVEDAEDVEDGGETGS